MLSDLQKRKFKRLFELYDANYDGLIEKSDLLAFAANLALANGHGPSSEAHQWLLKVYGDEWENGWLTLDVNHDTRVSLTEWLDDFEALLSRPGGAAAQVDEFLQHYHFLWDMLDPDDAGKGTTVRRYQHWLRAFGAPDADALGAEIVQRLDTDGDGLVSDHEMRQRQFEWFGDDPDAPGNFMFGPY